MDTTTNKLAERLKELAERFGEACCHLGDNRDPADKKPEWDVTSGRTLLYAALDEIAAQATQAVSEPVATQPAEAVAWRDVCAERQRQISSEGRTPEHDDEHSDGSLAAAAGCYARLAAEAVKLKMPPGWVENVGWFEAPDWPWDGGPKPAPLRRMLVKAGALILAELERIDRANGVAHPAPASASEPAREQCAECVTPLHCKSFGYSNCAYCPSASASVAGAGEALSEDTDDERCGPVSLESELRWRHEHDINNTPGYVGSLLWRRAEVALAARPVADGVATSVRSLKRLVREYADAFEDARYENANDIHYRICTHIDQLAALARQAPAPLLQAVPEGSLSAKLLAQLETTQAPHHARYTQHERDFYVSGFEDAMEFVRAELRTISQPQAVTSPNAEQLQRLLRASGYLTNTQAWDIARVMARSLHP